MKRYFCMTAVILMAMLTAAGCGNAAKKEASDVKVSVESVNKLSDEELHSLFQGTWETSVVFINNQDGIKFDIDRYVFKEDGTGTFTPYGGKTEMLSWTVSPLSSGNGKAAREMHRHRRIGPATCRFARQNVSGKRRIQHNSIEHYRRTSGNRTV